MTDELDKAAEEYAIEGWEILESEVSTHPDIQENIASFKAGALWERNRDKWISENDMVAEENINMLTCYIDVPDSSPTIAYRRGCCWYENFEGNEIGNITHWQELPALPKEEEK